MGNIHDGRLRINGQNDPFHGSHESIPCAEISGQGANFHAAGWALHRLSLGSIGRILNGRSPIPV